METKEEAAKSAEENRRLAREFERRGDTNKANAAYDRTFEAERCRDSWLYRMFGW